jgi:hypothetical protein
VRLRFRVKWPASDLIAAAERLGWDKAEVNTYEHRAQSRYLLTRPELQAASGEHEYQLARLLRALADAIDKPTGPDQGT